MALNTETAAALVAAAQSSKGRMMKIKVLRDFRIDGKVKKAGKLLEVPNALGIELIGANKAERVEDKPAKKDEEKPAE